MEWLRWRLVSNTAALGCVTPKVKSRQIRLRLRSLSSVTRLAIPRRSHNDPRCFSRQVCLQSAPWLSMGASDWARGRRGRECRLPVYCSRGVGGGRGGREFRRREPPEWIFHSPGVLFRHRHQSRHPRRYSGPTGRGFDRIVWPLLGIGDGHCFTPSRRCRLLGSADRNTEARLLASTRFGRDLPVWIYLQPWDFRRSSSSITHGRCRTSAAGIWITAGFSLRHWARLALSPRGPVRRSLDEVHRSGILGAGYSNYQWSRFARGQRLLHKGLHNPCLERVLPDNMQAMQIKAGLGIFLSVVSPFIPEPCT